MVANINWDLLKELYSVEGEINVVMDLMMRRSLKNVGWSGDRVVTITEYKQTWAVSVCCEPLSSLELSRKIEWGYNVIDKYCINI